MLRAGTDQRQQTVAIRSRFYSSTIITTTTISSVQSESLKNKEKLKLGTEQEEIREHLRTEKSGKGEVGEMLSKGRCLLFRRELPAQSQMAGPDQEGRDRREEAGSKSMKRGNLIVSMNFHCYRTQPVQVDFYITV